MEEVLEDLLFEEILPRLSVNCLMRLKLVSKKWHHLITADQRFISNHLRRQSETRELSLAMMSNIYQNNAIIFLDHRRNAVEFVHQSMDMRYFAGRFTWHVVIGSCDGLVCLHLRNYPSPPPLVCLQNTREAVVLWNPQTGEGRDTAAEPVLPVSFYYHRKAADQVVYGFGSDNQKPRADYKVVRVLPTTPAELSFDVFSRNRNRWRRLEKCLSGYTVSIESPNPVHLHSRLYFLILAVETRRRCVLFVDLRDDRFGVVDGLALGDRSPSVNWPAYPFPPRLVRWERNCLAYLSGCGGNELQLQMVLDGAGKVVGNTPLSSIGFSAPTAAAECRWKYCGVSRDRLLVIEWAPPLESKLVVYDYASTSVRRPREMLTLWNALFNTRLVGTPHDYVPSLVSVFADQRARLKEKKRMEVADLIATFGSYIGLNKNQFEIDY